MSEIRFLQPLAGDLLIEGADGEMREGRFYAQVRVRADAGSLRINGVRAERDEQGVFCARVPLDALRGRLEARDERGNRAAITVFRLRDAEKSYRFTVDDCIRCFEDLTRNQDRYQSIFENPFLAIFHRAHEQYGSRVHLNLFYESVDGTFNLSMMTDRFREEFERNADWLSLTFHARREFPNAPYRNASYEEIYRDGRDCIREIIRFAGKKVLRDTTTLHFGACTADGVRALRGLGYRALCGYLDFDEQGNTLVSYHLTPEQVAYAKTREGWYDADEDVVLTRLDFVLNALELTADRVEPLLDELCTRAHEGRLIQMVIHEQYFYEDYFNYEPDYAERILAMARWMHAHGYRSASLSEMIREEDAREVRL